MSKPSNSVRFCKQIPVGIYERFAKYAEDAGMDEREAFIALVNQFIPKLRDEAETKTKPIDPKRRYNELVKQIKPYVDNINAGTITRTELVAMDPISREICEVRQLMGMESGYVDRVAQFDKTRAEAEATIHQMEHELEQLQTLSRQSPLDDVDTYRARELLGLIKRYRYNLDVDYPL